MIRDPVDPCAQSLDGETKVFQDGPVIQSQTPQSGLQVPTRPTRAQSTEIDDVWLVNKGPPNRVHASDSSQISPMLMKGAGDHEHNLLTPKPRFQIGSLHRNA
jgi:hypothetical protein